MWLLSASVMWITAISPDGSIPVGGDGRDTCWPDGSAVRCCPVSKCDAAMTKITVRTSGVGRATGVHESALTSFSISRSRDLGPMTPVLF